jgi:hypothetical protein
VHQGRDWIGRACASGINGIVCPEAIVRSSAQREVGGYRADLPYTSDMEMWLRLASVGDVIQDRGDYAAFTRVSPASMSAVAESSMIRVLEIRRDAFSAWHEYADELVPGADALLARAHNTLARAAMSRAYTAFMSNPDGDDEPDIMCKFALDLAPDWATPRVRRLNAVRRSSMIRAALGHIPVGDTWFRAKRASRVARRRLTRFPVK